jgi:hypothetical protein
MPALAPAALAPASYRNPDSPADQALAKIVDLLLPAGYGFTIPAWDGDAYLRINNALRALTALTITSHGNVTWEYRSAEYPHLQPLAEIIRFYLHCYGLTATVTETGTDTGPVLTASNPARPYRGTIEISDDGELEWRTRAPHHPDGGIPPGSTQRELPVPYNGDDADYIQRPGSANIVDISNLRPDLKPAQEALR